MNTLFLIIILSIVLTGGLFIALWLLLKKSNGKSVTTTPAIVITTTPSTVTTDPLASCYNFYRAPLNENSSIEYTPSKDGNEYIIGNATATGILNCIEFSAFYNSNSDVNPSNYVIITVLNDSGTIIYTSNQCVFKTTLFVNFFKFSNLNLSINYKYKIKIKVFGSDYTLTFNTITLFIDTDNPPIQFDYLYNFTESSVNKNINRLLEIKTINPVNLIIFNPATFLIDIHTFKFPIKLSGTLTYIVISFDYNSNDSSDSNSQLQLSIQGVSWASRLYIITPGKNNFYIYPIIRNVNTTFNLNLTINADPNKISNFKLTLYIIPSEQPQKLISNIDRCIHSTTPCDKKINLYTLPYDCFVNDITFNYICDIVTGSSNQNPKFNINLNRYNSEYSNLDTGNLTEVIYPNISAKKDDVVYLNLSNNSGISLTKMTIELNVIPSNPISMISTTPSINIPTPSLTSRKLEIKFSDSNNSQIINVLEKPPFPFYISPYDKSYDPNNLTYTYALLKYDPCSSKPLIDCSNYNNFNSDCYDRYLEFFPTKIEILDNSDSGKISLNFISKSVDSSKCTAVMKTLIDQMIDIGVYNIDLSSSQYTNGSLLLTIDYS
jgi:hypothetical protein